MALTEPLTIRFSPKQSEKLAHAAELEERSQGAVIRRLVDQLEAPTTDSTDQEKKR